MRTLVPVKGLAAAGAEKKIVIDFVACLPFAKKKRSKCYLRTSQMAERSHGVHDFRPNIPMEDKWTKG